MNDARGAPAPIPLIDLAAVHAPVADDLRAAFERLLASSAFTLGAEVERFETMLAASVGVRHAVGVASGTAALHLSLVAAGIGPGDEVILPPNTFFATAEAIVASGATPVLADVDPDTALLDPGAVEAAVSPRTAAIAAVHLYGQPVDAGRFESIAERYGLLLLEDAAQAIGAAWHGRPAGGLGHAAAFSFYPGKNVGALGDAGAVTTDDPQLARRVRLLRSHGEAAKHVHEVAGLCERLDALQAAFLAVKLARWDESQRLRDEAASRYGRLLAVVPGVAPLVTRRGARHVHHLFVVRVPDRDRVLGRLRAGGVQAAVHYPTPIHLQPASTALGKRGQFPHAEALASSIVSLPLFPGITDDQVDRVVDTLAAGIRDVA